VILQYFLWLPQAYVQLVLPHIVNAAIFTSAFSAGNSFLFCASRVLYGLALRGQAPRVLTYCTKKGLPLYAVLVTSCFTVLSFMSVSKGSNTVFKYVVLFALPMFVFDEGLQLVRELVDYWRIHKLVHYEFDLRSLP